MARTAPIEPAAWPDTLADIRRQMGNPLNVHRAPANHPAWLRAWFPFRNHVVHGTSISSGQYELVVLRVATLTDAAYEWEHHVVTAKEAGLDEEEIGRVRAGGDAPGWSRDEPALLRAVDDGGSRCKTRPEHRCRSQRVVPAVRPLRRRLAPAAQQRPPFRALESRIRGNRRFLPLRARWSARAGLNQFRRWIP